MSARMAGWALGAVVLAGVVAAVVFAVYCAFVVSLSRIRCESAHAPFFPSNRRRTLAGPAEPPAGVRRGETRAPVRRTRLSGALPLGDRLCARGDGQATAGVRAGPSAGSEIASRGLRGTRIRGVRDPTHAPFVPRLALVEVRSSQRRAGLVYFQGALVDAVAYAPLCRSIAQQTPAIVCLIQSPLRLSFFCGLKRARAAMADFEGVDVWNLGGHSLGGTTACNLVAETKAEKKIGASGVCMHAAYSLLDVCTVPGLRSLQVLAELDGIVSSDKLHANAKFLPDDIKARILRRHSFSP